MSGNVVWGFRTQVTCGLILLVVGQDQREPTSGIRALARLESITEAVFVTVHRYIAFLVEISGCFWN